ncbi:hypothetical protein ABQE93_20900 [Mycolicibacterium sp. XJ662]
MQDNTSDDAEQPCPGWITGKCVACDCPWLTDYPDTAAGDFIGAVRANRPYAPKGAALPGGDGVRPWEQAHPEDVAELERRRAQRAQRQATWRNVQRRTVKNVTPRALKALTDEGNTLAHTARGGRNEQANTSAFNLGQLVAMGEVPERLVKEELWAACQINGLIRDDGEASVKASLRSGLEAGKREPRQ